MAPFEEKYACPLGDSDTVLLWGGHIRISLQELERGDEGHVAFEKLFSEAVMHISSLQTHASSLDIFLKLQILVNLWIAP